MGSEKNRKSIGWRVSSWLGKIFCRSAKGAGKLTARAGTKIWQKRDSIRGAAVGGIQVAGSTVRDSSSHFGYKRRIEKKSATLEELAKRQKSLVAQFKSRILEPRATRNTILDTLAIGGETLYTYTRRGEIPEHVQKAYEGAYPALAANDDFLERVQQLDESQLIGFVSGVKGMLFELQYVDYLNQGTLPEGYEAIIADNPTNPGWDIGILGPEGELKRLIQAKATESTQYVRSALENHPHIDVVTTSEVNAQLLVQGMADRVIDSGIRLEDLNADIKGAIDMADIAMDWTPPVVTIALIAFTSYSRPALKEYERSREFGKRTGTAYLAYLAGGAVAVASGTVWLGMLGAVGTRLVLASGKKKSAELSKLNELIKENKNAQKRLEKQVTDRPFWKPRWLW